VSLLNSYQLRYCTYVEMKLCANVGIKCLELLCLEHVLIVYVLMQCWSFPFKYMLFLAMPYKKCARNRMLNAQYNIRISLQTHSHNRHLLWLMLC
jgi:hypothetical protein